MPPFTRSVRGEARLCLLKPLESAAWRRCPLRPLICCLHYHFPSSPTLFNYYVHTTPWRYEGAAVTPPPNPFPHHAQKGYSAHLSRASFSRGQQPAEEARGLSSPRPLSPVLRWSAPTAQYTAQPVTLVQVVDSFGAAARVGGIVRVQECRHSSKHPLAGIQVTHPT